MLYRNAKRFGDVRRRVRRRCRLLRLRAAVHQLRARLAVLRHHRRAVDHRARARAQRWRDVRVADPDAQLRRPRPHRRAARRPRRPQGSGLLGAPVRDHQRAARFRPGGDLLGRPRPATGAAAAVRGGDRHRRAVPVDAAHGVVAAAADLIGDLARSRRARRLHLSGSRPGTRCQPQPEGPGGAVHRAQRVRDTGGDGTRRRQVASVPISFDTLERGDDRRER